MATNEQILNEIQALKDEQGEVLKLAKSNDRALRGHNNTIGIVARVISIEKHQVERDEKVALSTKVTLGFFVTVSGAVMIDIALRLVDKVF